MTEPVRGPIPVNYSLPAIERCLVAIRKKGYGDRDARAIAMSWNEAIPQPWPEDVVEELVVRVYETRLATDAPEGAGEAWEPPAEPEPPKTWNALDLYLADLKPPDGQFAGKALCRQSVSLLLGEGGVGKTYIALGIARAAALSEPFGEIEVTSGNVLFLSEEMTESEMHGRLRELFSLEELERIAPEKRLKIRCRAGLKADTDEGLTEIRKIIQGEGSPQFVFVDALVDIHSKNENSNTEMGPVFRGLRDHVATPCNTSLTVLHHAGKPGEFLSGSNRSRGASVIRDICADVILVEGRKSGRVRDVTFPKCRHGGTNPPHPFSVELVQQPNGIYTLAIGDAGTTHEFEKAAKVIALVKSQGGRLFRQQIVEMMKAAHGWSARTVDAAIGDAVGAGLLQRCEKIGKETPYETC